MKSSKPKMAFMVLMAVGIVFALATDGLPSLPTSKPISITYDEMMDEIYLSGLTTAQEDARKGDFVGKRVAWSGYVVDAKKQGWSYTVQLSEGDHAAMTDIFLEGVDKAQAVSLSHGDQVRFEGKIDRFTDGILTGYVHLTSVTIQ
ncbi:hypothetical protein MLC59_01960 [Marinobacter bryozoorum]|uniref:hypothetical protein n=1 Tax=Marinobacter bryozoorum TaxID=256324 RepID=UPI002005E412|nr:hypothetical protein [Marinobacter bryozoorum]MCK7542935.1 hypothetical protein [Marinobacter bryozoorum]